MEGETKCKCGKMHAPVLIDGVKCALNIQRARQERRAAFSLPLLAESKQVGADFMNSLNVGGCVALNAFVLMPQHMKQRL